MAADWRVDILRGLGAPVTPQNLSFLSAWQRWEGGHTNNDARFNWLNTTSGSRYAAINDVGVRRFPDYRTGIRYTLRTIRNGRYGDIIKALRKGDPYAVKPVAGLSTWVSGSPTGNLSYAQKVLGTKLDSGEVGESTTSATDTTLPSRPTVGKNVTAAPFGDVTSMLLSARGVQSSQPDQSRSDQPLPFSQITSKLIGKRQGTEARHQIHRQGGDPRREIFARSLQRLSGKPEPGLRDTEETGQPPEPTKEEKVGKPGGGWGGSYALATSAAEIGRGMGLKVISEKRDTKNTLSGGRSDHWVGSKDSYAYDLSNGDQPTPEMDAAAVRLARMLGVEYDGKGELVLTKTIGGYRYQILYRTEVGGDHFNHIHFGVRRV